MATNENANVNVNVNGEAAQDQLTVLQKQAKKFRLEMEKANKAGDVKGFKNAERDFKAVNKQARQLAKNTFDVEKVLKSLNKATPRELTRAYRELNRVINSGDVKRGSAEWKRYANNLKRVKAEQMKVNTEIRGSQPLISRLANGFNKYFMIIGSGIASLTGLIFSFRKAIDASNEFESSIANLSALTGLVGKELDYLKQRALDFSGSTTEAGIRITKSAQDIIDAYTQMGSKRPELLKDKEALASVTEEAIILSQAAKMELVPATNSLAISMNQFNAKAKDAKRYINTIAAGSKEGAGDVLYIASALEKAGTAAETAGLNIEETVGVIETIAPKFSEPARAGTQLKNVFIRLQTGADEFNPAIVGMTKALENLSDANLTTTQMVKMFGTENLNAAQTLVDGTEEYKRYKDAVTGTNVAVEQAIKNTGTNKAKLEAARQSLNKVTIELGKKLAPALTFSTSGFSYLIRGVIKAIRFFKEYKNIIISAIAGIAAYTIAVNAATIGTKIYTAATWLAEKATRAFNLATKSNPIGLIIGLIASAATAIFLYSKKTKDATKEQKEFNTELEKTGAILGEDIYQNLKAKHKDFLKWSTEASRKDLNAVKNFMEQRIGELNRQLENLKPEDKKRFSKYWEDEKNKISKEISIIENELKKLNPKTTIGGETEEERKKRFEKLLDILKEANQVEENELKRKRAQDLITEETYQTELFALEQAYLFSRKALYEQFGENTTAIDGEMLDGQIAFMKAREGEYKKMLQNIMKSEDDFNKDIDQMMDSDMQDYINRLDNEIALEKEAFKQKEQMAMDFGAQIGNLIGTAMDDQTDAAKRFSKHLIMITLDTLRKLANAAIAKIAFEALASPDSVATFGVSGLAKIAGLTLLVEGAYATAAAALQYNKGRYPVKGANDGQMYFPDQIISNPATGIVKGPALISEVQDEMIIDGATTQRLIYNHPEIVNGIKALSQGFTPQFADGRYPQSTKEIRTETFTDPALLAMLELVAERLKTPAKAYVLMDEDNIDNIQQGLDNKSDFLKTVNA